jgi:hypothetical protein
VNEADDRENLRLHNAKRTPDPVPVISIKLQLGLPSDESLIEAQIPGLPSSPKSTFVAQAVPARKRIISHTENDHIKKSYTGKFMLLQEIYKQQTGFLLASSTVLHKLRSLFEDMQNDTTLLPFGHVP